MCGEKVAQGLPLREPLRKRAAWGRDHSLPRPTGLSHTSLYFLAEALTLRQLAAYTNLLAGQIGVLVCYELRPENIWGRKLRQSACRAVDLQTKVCLERLLVTQASQGARAFYGSGGQITAPSLEGALREPSG